MVTEKVRMASHVIFATNSSWVEHMHNMSMLVNNMCVTCCVELSRSENFKSPAALAISCSAIVATATFYA